MGSLKRCVAREFFGRLLRPGSVPLGTDLRQARREARLSLANVAVLLGSWSGRIPGLERGVHYDTHVPLRYHAMLASIDLSAAGTAVTKLDGHLIPLEPLNVDTLVATCKATLQKWKVQEICYMQPITLKSGLLAAIDVAQELVNEAHWQYGNESPAYREANSAEKRSDQAPWGSEPLRSVHFYARTAIIFAMEMAASLAILLDPPRPSPSQEVISRTALEAGSSAWWLLDGDISVRQRYSRMQLLYVEGLRNYKDAAGTAQNGSGFDFDAQLALVRDICREYGLRWTGQNESSLEGEKLPKYTSRCQRMLRAKGWKGQYQIYSSVAHAALPGMLRMFGEPQGSDISTERTYIPSPNPELSRNAAATTAMAFVAPLERAAIHLGWAKTIAGRKFDQMMDDLDGMLFASD